MIISLLEYWGDLSKQRQYGERGKVFMSHHHDHDGHDHAHGHDHDHDHDHGHHHGPSWMGHVHAPANFGEAFAIGIILNITYVIIEVAYGFISNSVALLADAGHNLGDVLGLLVAWIAA